MPLLSVTTLPLNLGGAEPYGSQEASLWVWNVREVAECVRPPARSPGGLEAPGRPTQPAPVGGRENGVRGRGWGHPPHSPGPTGKVGACAAGPGTPQAAWGATEDSATNPAGVLMGGASVQGAEGSETPVSAPLTKKQHFDFGEFFFFF